MAELDSGVLTLEATDLAIDSFGPVAGVSRTYRSDVANASLFSLGWRFNFEQSVISSSSGSRIYTDARGQRHRFLAAGANTWRAPHSLVATLTWDATASEYCLLFKGGATVRFESGGLLKSETDRHGNSVVYTWNGTNGVTVEAANGHTIEVTFSGTPSKVAYATYTAGAITRQVDYSAGANSVTKHLSAAEHATVVYGYAGDKVSEVSAQDFAPGGVPAIWTVTWSGAQLQSVHFPHPSSISQRTTALALDSANRTASVSRRARVGTASVDSTVTETYMWNPTGRQIARGLPASSAQSREGTDTSDFAPSGEARLSATAAGVITDSVTDNRCNELISSDVDGHATASVYDEMDDLVMATDPRGSVTTYSYNTSGDPLVERQTLNDTESSETSRTYDAQGRLLSEGQLIDSSGARAYATYEYATAFDEPVRTVQHDVAFSATRSVDLTSLQALDAFGQSTISTDAVGVRVSSVTYDLAGRAVDETDAAGTVTHRRYDLLGAEVETSRTAGGAWADWTSRTVDPTGLVLTEQSLITSAGAVVPADTTAHIYDGSGAEIKLGVSDEGTATTAYDQKGDVAATWQPGVGTDTTSTAQTIETDADGRELQSQLTTGTPALTEYAEGGDEVASYDPPEADATSYEYDEAGNEIATIIPVPSGTATETREYDLVDREVKSIDASENVTVTYYDLLGRATTTMLENAGRATTTSYNALGWPLSQTDPDGIVTRYVYDATGRVTEAVVAVNGAADSTTSHRFDASGNETLTVNPDGTRVQTTFDVFGRAVRRAEIVGGVTVHDVVSALDQTGRAAEASDTVLGLRSTHWFATSTSGFNVTTKTLPDATITVSVSAAGMETTRTMSVKGAPVLGVLTASVLSRNLAQVPETWKVSFPGIGMLYRQDTFDEQGRMLCQADHAGTLWLLAGYGYDERTGQRIRDYMGATLLSVQDSIYTYTDAGRLSSVAVDGSTTEYLYDAAGQITKAGQKTLGYSDGKIATSAVSGVTTSYTFDARGRRTRESSTSRVATYTWDAQADRLTAYKLDRAPLGSTDVSASFSYDASGQRTRSVVTSAGVTTTSTYTYEGLQLTRLASVTGTVTTTLTYLYDELARPLAIMTSSSDTTAVYSVSASVNARGDVRALVDLTLKPLASWTFDPWGNPIAAASAGTTGSAQVPATMAARIAAVQPLRYAGYAYDSFSGP
jgi:YD repeat-containing protein